MEAPTKELPKRTRQPIASRQPKLVHFNLQASLQAAVPFKHRSPSQLARASLFFCTTTHNAQHSPLPPVLNSRSTALLRSPTCFISPEPTKAPGASPPPFTDVSGPALGPIEFANFASRHTCPQAQPIGLPRRTRTTVERRSTQPRNARGSEPSLFFNRDDVSLFSTFSR